MSLLDRVDRQLAACSALGLGMLAAPAAADIVAAPSFSYAPGQNTTVLFFLDDYATPIAKYYAGTPSAGFAAYASADFAGVYSYTYSKTGAGPVYYYTTVKALYFVDNGSNTTTELYFAADGYFVSPLPPGGTYYYGALYGSGASIGPGSPFTPYDVDNPVMYASAYYKIAASGTTFYSASYGPGGNWSYGTSGYMGFRAVIGGSEYFGWVAAAMDGSYGPYGPTFTGLAWETTADTAILAGAVPEPGALSLAALALGAAGLRRRRRERQTA